MKDILFPIFIYFSIISSISSIIIIPFQTYNPLLTNNETLLKLIKNLDDKSLIDTLTNNLIYTRINLGNNFKNISAFIEMATKEFIVKDITINLPNNNPNVENLNFCFDKNILLKDLFKREYYNSSKSITYDYVEDCDDIYFDFLQIKNFCGNEKVELIQKNNINDKGTIISNNFYIKFKALNEYDQRQGIIGLNYDNNFISVLKEKNKIDKYDFNFKYTSPLEDKGELIIGDLPHIYDSNSYEEKNLRSAKLIKNDYILKWKTKFDVYNLDPNKKASILEIDEDTIFNIEDFFITASHKYYEYIDTNFFDKYKKERICKSIVYSNIYSKESYFYYICNINDQKKRQEFFDDFPQLIFYQKEMDCNFTLNAEDLFTQIPDDERILFNIKLMFNSNKWILGKPFFKKYQLIFNFDSNLISYYINSKEININKEENKEGGNGLKIFLIIFLTILAFAVGIIFGRAMCVRYNRKMRANELEDNFTYIADNSIKDDNKNDLKDNNFQINNLKSKYYNLN